MNFLLKNKGKQLHRTSNNNEIKHVAIKHPQTAFNLSKAIEHSNITTHKLDTVQKSNIIDIDLAPIEHPKTATKLSRSIKNPKIRNQQL